MDPKKPYKDMIKGQGATYASLYGKKHSMQSGNLKKLMKYLLGSKVRLPEGKCLDLGCGTGILARELKEKYQGMKITYYGIDLSYDKIEEAKNNNPSLNNFIVADADCLPFQDESFDAVISNTTLHWVNIPKIDAPPTEALGEALRVLKTDSPLAMSISGYGSAKSFQESYHKMIGYFKNNPEFNTDLYRKDPIGNMHLIDLVNILIEVGFEIERAQLNYEPVKYKHPANYVEDVKAYGYKQYVAPIPELDRERAWKMIEDDFVAKSGDGEYEYHQYMIYAIALKAKTKGNLRFHQK